MNLKFKDYPEKQMIEIEGINYSYELFKGFGGELKLYEPFVVTERKKGIISINRLGPIKPKKIIRRITIEKPWFCPLGLRISARAANCLCSIGIKSIKDLLEFTEEELLKYKNLGRHTLTDIKNNLHDLGLKLKERQI